MDGYAFRVAATPNIDSMATATANLTIATVRPAFKERRAEVDGQQNSVCILSLVFILFFENLDLENNFYESELSYPCSPSTQGLG